MRIYQIVHTLGGVVYHLEEHLKLLFEGYYEIFGVGVRIDKCAVQRDISALLARSRCPSDVSLFLRLEIDDQGVLSVREWERSLYRGYSMRCISPRAAVVNFNIPHIEYPTTLREDIIAFANRQALRRSGDVALREHNGVVDMIGGAQIFALTSRGLVTAAHSYSVEHALLKKLARKIDVNIIEREIRVEELAHFDELFFADHYGITSIRTCAMRSYLSVMASTLSKLLAAEN